MGAQAALMLAKTRRIEAEIGLLLARTAKIRAEITEHYSPTQAQELKKLEERNAKVWDRVKAGTDLGFIELVHSVFWGYFWDTESYLQSFQP